ncbi:RNA-guided endonuclease InsQ/TnpB family protein [Sporosarcina soli]|uniref:RNA-guided endonuclease InsQ/TnpB family protein n=1 Tax=Sporosarcina soli TaxID=334736 RepID=A0ABW0TDM8_9BACL
MFVTHSFKIPYDEQLYAELRDMQREAASVWNDIVREATSYYFSFRKWLSKTDIQAVRKQTYHLHSQTVQAIADKYVANRETIRQLRKTDKKAKYPWRKKQYYCIPLKKAAMDISADTIAIKKVTYELDLPALLTKKKDWHQKYPKKYHSVKFSNLSKENLAKCNYAEVVWRNGAYWFCYAITVPEKDISTYPFKAAGADLGEIHAVTVATEEKALLVSGRAMRSVSQFRAKALAELSKLMSRCKKGSRQWKKFQRARARIRQKTANQLAALEHQTTKEIVAFLEAEQVTHLVIGDVSGIEKNTKKKGPRKTSRKRRQQLSLWNQGKVKQKLTYKAQLKGIQVKVTEESYTSQDCPFCHGRHQANGRNFSCSVHKTEIHRDINGAQNIVRKKYPMAVKTILSVVYKQPVWLKRHLSFEDRQKIKHPNDLPKQVKRIAEWTA